MFEFLFWGEPKVANYVSYEYDRRNLIVALSIYKFDVMYFVQYISILPLRCLSYVIWMVYANGLENS